MGGLIVILAFVSVAALLFAFDIEKKYRTIKQLKEILGVRETALEHHREVYRRHDAQITAQAKRIEALEHDLESCMKDWKKAVSRCEELEGVTARFSDHISSMRGICRIMADAPTGGDLLESVRRSRS